MIKRSVIGCGILSMFAFAALAQTTIAKNNTSENANKTTAAMSRLIAHCNRIFDGTAYIPADSGHNTYTGNHGYDPKANEWEYSYFIGMPYNATTQSYSDYYRVNRTFDAQGRILTSLGENNITSWQPARFEAYTYDAAGQITVYLNTYDAGTGWDSLKYYFAYNAAGQMTEEIKTRRMAPMGQWENATRYSYTYNTAGMLSVSATDEWVANAWLPTYKYTNTYTGSNITSILGEVYKSAWADTTTVANTYDSYGNLLLSEEKVWNGTTWVNSQRYTNAYDNNNDMVTQVKETYNGTAYDNTWKVVKSYNAYNQVLVETHLSWDVANQQFTPLANDMEFRSYYEEYNTGINDAAVNSFTGISIYPVPASGLLQITAAGNTLNGAVLQLFSSNGSLVCSYTIPPGAQTVYTINIAQLPAGNYLLCIHWDGKALYRQISIVH